MSKKKYYKEKKAAYYIKNKEKSLAYQRIRYLKDPEGWKLKGRARRLRKQYWPHLTPDQALLEYDRLHTLQDGKCAICGKPEVKVDPQLGRPCVLAVDHCHVTLKVRGLLCFRCNTNLGWYEEMKVKFMAYLENV